MTKFKVHGEVIEARSFDAAYAIRFNVSVAEAIADRDEPQTYTQLYDRYVEAVGHPPTDAEMDTMRPDSEDDVREFLIARQS